MGKGENTCYLLHVICVCRIGVVINCFAFFKENSAVLSEACCCQCHSYLGHHVKLLTFLMSVSLMNMLNWTNYFPIIKVGNHQNMFDTVIPPSSIGSFNENQSSSKCSRGQVFAPAWDALFLL